MTGPALLSVAARDAVRDAPSTPADASLVEAGTRLLVAQLVLFACLVAGVLLAAAVGRWWRARHQRQLAEARDVLTRCLLHDAHGAPADLARLAALPWRVREALALEFGRTLRGVSVRRLSAIGARLGLVARAAAQCGSRWWWRRLQGARVLGALDHDCPPLRTLLDDPHPTVRAEVLHWAAGRADGNVIAALVERLVDPARLCRFTVRDSLLRLGPPAADALAALLARDDLVTAHDPLLADALLVARGLAQPVLLDPVLVLCEHPTALVRARATSVLGAIGGDRAATMLLQRVRDEDASVREAAARAIGEIGHWDGAATLAERLADPAFPVRRESALALRRLGSVGVLVLRRARGDANPFVADMATQVLDLPESVFHRLAA